MEALSVAKCARARRGFTAVEALVAIVLLAVGVLGLAATVRVVSASLRDSYLRTRVTVEARSVMEELVASGYQRLAPGARDRGDGLTVEWHVRGGDTKEVVVVARLFLQEQFVDTLARLVRAQ